MVHDKDKRNSLDTQPIFNEHKRFSCCPERYMKVLCTLSLGHKSTGLKLYEESFEKYLS